MCISPPFETTANCYTSVCRTLLAIQNMTWNGWQGFRDFPGIGLYTPPHQDLPGSIAGSGYLGKFGHERGLTFYQIQLAGHMVPGDAPGE